MAQNRREFELNNLIMNGKREDEWSKELVKREQKIKAKMKRAEVNVSYLINIAPLWAQFQHKSVKDEN